MRIYYPFRILLDYDFLKWILSNSERKAKTIIKLMKINNSSRDHKKCHILILKEDFETLKSENLIKSVDLFKGGITIVDKRISEIDPEFNDEGVTLLEKRCIYGVYLTDNLPYKIYLLTTSSKIQSYNDTGFLTHISDLTLKSSEEGLWLIDSLFDKFKRDKESLDFCGY